MKFYLVGIKGSGMCALANILYNLGYSVRGCDYNEKFFTDKKLNKNIKVEDIDKFKCKKKYTYIIGNAFKGKFDIESFYDYPDFIEKFFRMSKVSISGTHGKTTTTNFISQISNVNINVLCGDGTGVANKQADYFILEACEYKNTFLNYTNKILVINNIEFDHPDFFSNINDVLCSFQKAANNSQIVVVNGDCENSLRIKHYNIIRFGKSDYNDIKFIYKNTLENSIVTIYFYGNKEDIILPLLAEHNIYNYVASYIVSKLIGSDDEYIVEKSLELSFPKRRLEIYEKGNSIVIDDYAHHPTEIKSTLSFVKKRYNKRVIVFFQPHTYSRTKEFINEFVDSLSIADEVYILDVFSSVREQGDENLLLNNFSKFDESMLENIKEESNVYVFMGAGDINNLINYI